MPDRPLYIHSLFVSYPKEVPSAQRIGTVEACSVGPRIRLR